MSKDKKNKDSLTPEQKEAELRARIDGFNKELKPLLAKYELGIGALPVIMADGRLAANPLVVDARQRPENKMTEA